MSSVDNSEGESDVTINQTLVEDAKNIFKNLGSPELTNMFDMLVRSYENSRLETSKNDNANLEDTNVISKVSTYMKMISKQINEILCQSSLQGSSKNRTNHVMEPKNFHLIRIDPHPNLRSLFHGCNIRFGPNVELV